MEKIKSKFNEVGTLSGKSNLKFKGIDQVGSFWVVTKPTPSSEIEDIFFEADIFDFALQIKGGLSGGDVIGIYKDKNKAEKEALKLLK